MSHQEAPITDAPKKQILCGYVQSAVESSYRRYVHATELVRRFSEALRLVEKRNDEAASSDSTGESGALGGTHLDSAVVFSSKEHDVLLYVDATDAHTRRWKHNPSSMDAFSKSVPPLFCKSSKSWHRSEYEKHHSTFDAFVLTEPLQIKSFSLLVGKMHLSTTSIFSLDAADKKRLLTAPARARAQRILRAITKQLAFGEKKAIPPPVAVGSLPFSTPG